VSALGLRLGAYGLFAGVLLATLASAAGLVPPAGPRLHALFAAGAALGLACAWLGLRRFRRRGRPPGRALRALDLVAWNALLALVAGEIAVRALQRLAPSQLLWDESDAGATIRALRRCHRSAHFPYLCNSRRYVDEELFDPAPEDYAVALLADSFGVASVPWAYNFATLAERELRARLGARHPSVAIDNLGVTGANVPEYLWLYQNEVRGRDYDQVVVCFFVGNDLDFSEVQGRSTDLRRLVRLQGWLAPEVVRRLVEVARGLEHVGDVPAGPVSDEPAFLRDPSLEPPFFDEGTFLRIEADRVRYTALRNPVLGALYQRAFRQLDALHAELGDRLLVVVIPDEFQVNDALWERALDHAIRTYTDLSPDEGRAAFARDLPQRKLAVWARRRGVRLLDLLPALRAAEREARTYHLRDTHWNAHGNRVAGRLLAEALLSADGSAALVAPGDPRHPPGAREPRAAGEGGSGR
jgi:hypothetical protein